MSITSAQLKHLASLAYLDIDVSSESELKADINSMIEFVSQLQSVDTKQVAPLMHPMDAIQPMRADESCSDVLTPELGDIAPQFQDNLYLVPKVITTER